VLFVIRVLAALFLLVLSLGVIGIIVPLKFLRLSRRGAAVLTLVTLVAGVPFSLYASHLAQTMVPVLTSIQVDGKQIIAGQTAESVVGTLNPYMNTSRKPEEWKEDDGSYGHTMYYLIKGNTCSVKYEKGIVTDVYCGDLSNRAKSSSMSQISEIPAAQLAAACRSHIPAASDNDQPNAAVKAAARKCWTFATTHSNDAVGPNPIVNLSDKSMQNIIDWSRDDSVDGHSWSVIIAFKDGYEASCDQISDNGQVELEGFATFRQALPECPEKK
jgi:hypothetical protein